MRQLLSMEGSKTSFHSSKFPRAREEISSKFIDNLAICPQEGSPALLYSIGLQPFFMENGNVSYSGLVRGTHVEK